MSTTVLPAPRLLPDVPAERIPRHIAIIMDGNGRWAVRQQMDRALGHRRGADVVVDIVEACVNLRNARGGPDFLTLYSFSVENWKRPVAEVEALMRLYIEFLSRQRPQLIANNVRYNQIGRSHELPDAVVEEMNRTLAATASNTGLTLTLAINYGSRTEITDAVRDIAREVEAGRLSPAQITEQTLSRHLYTRDMPDVDLLIRTAGEMRLSNYLLWQISYAELVVSPKLWPEFTEEDLHACIRAYAQRNRRFGALDNTNTLPRTPPRSAADDAP
ncbi:MAG: isoprenyl transferase [Tepidisphaerales bacterium]